MSLEQLLGIVRDVLVLGYMFVVRIGVPIMITLMLGWWLQKLLEEKEPVQEEKPAEPEAATQPSVLK